MKIKGCKRQSFLDQATLNGGQPIFYLIRCWDKEETFYKLGITVNNILTRYGSVKSMPYEWEILLELPGTAEAVYDMEVQFKTEPYRVCRRVNILRDYPDDKIKIYP